MLTICTPDLWQADLRLEHKLEERKENGAQDPDIPKEKDGRIKHLQHTCMIV